jgi:hypothetical protein
MGVRGSKDQEIGEINKKRVNRVKKTVYKDFITKRVYKKILVA